MDLIYIDPPFNVGGDFSFTATVPDNPDGEVEEPLRFVKDASVIEVKAYRDTWGRGLDSYMQWFYEAVVLLRELLAEEGSLYVHLDWHVGHYAKAVLDEVFGRDMAQNEIVWKRTSARSDSHTYNHIHDIIFLYTKGDNFKFNVQYTAYDQTYIENFYRYIAPGTGRLFRVSDLTAAGTRRGSSGQPWRGIDPNIRGNHWKYTIEKLEELDQQGRIYWPQKEGGVPGYKRYLDEMPGVPLQSIWTDINPISAQAAENTNYSTQKPEALLERIIQASSNEGDLVLDCFCGSGTTAAVAEKLNRRWIACDLGRFAIHTTRKRLLSIPDVRPFVVQNLGKYERQAWQAAEFGDTQKAAAVTHQYRRFILDLYHARPVEGYAWLHGVKGGRMVHVGPVDSPISPSDVTQIAIEFRKAVGTGQDAPSVAAVDVLGWDFAFELNEIAKQQAAQANITMRFIRIPREVLEQKAVEQGDIKFFELAALAVDVAQGRGGSRTALTPSQGGSRTAPTVTLKLTDFVIPPDDVPEDVQRAISHWSQWIDYWAVDWDNQGDTFHNMWQTYRTRQSKGLQLQVTHEYERPGEYVIMMKVIDILGNDTTKTLKVVV